VGELQFARSAAQPAAELELAGRLRWPSAKLQHAPRRCWLVAELELAPRWSSLRPPFPFAADDGGAWLCGQPRCRVSLDMRRLLHPDDRRRRQPLMAVSMASLHFSSCSLSPPRARRREHASRQHKHASSALACQPPPLLGMCPERRNRRRIDELGGGGGSSAACSSWRSEAESRASLGRSSFAPGLELGGGGSKAAPLLPRRLRA
jgi:hypothetical protein